MWLMSMDNCVKELNEVLLLPELYLGCPN